MIGGPTNIGAVEGVPGGGAAAIACSTLTLTDAAVGTLICVSGALRTYVPAPVVATFREVIAAF